MANTDPIITNFTSGELSPFIEGRVDVSKYFNGAKTLENVLISQYGGVYRTPGSIYAAEAKDSSKEIRIISFQFSVEQAYIIEIGDQYMRFYKDGGQIVETDKVISAISQANPAVVTANSHGFSTGEQVYINSVAGMTELNGKRFTVTRIDANTFSLQGVDSTSYMPYSSGGVAQRVYEITTPYLESDLFNLQFAQSADVLYIVHKGYKPRKLTRTGHTSWSLDEIEFINGPYMPDNSDDTHTLAPSAATGSITIVSTKDVFAGGQVGGFFRIKDGYCRITSVTDAKNANAEVLLDLGIAVATDDWAEGAWSDYRGYPSSVTFYEQRLFFAGSNSEPQTVWGSKNYEFENFTPGSNDDDALTYEINSEQVNACRWLSAGRKLSVGTAGGAFNLSGSGELDPLTPSNVNVRRETTYGSSNIIPKRIGNFVYYVQRNTRTIREFAYSFEIDSFESLDMTLLAEHITESGIVDMDYQQSPNNVLWCVRADGQLATMTRQIDQKVIAWSRQTTDGAYESVAVIPQTEEDQVWTVVKRTINGQTKRYIEYFKPIDFGSDKTDAYFVHCGLSYDGVAASTFSGLEHLEGKTVSILVDGAVYADKVVSNGAVSLDGDDTAEKVHIGLPYTSKVRTVRMESGSQLGTAQGKKKRIYEVVLRLYRTLGIKMGPDDDNLDEVLFRSTDDAMDDSPALFTGDTDPIPFGDDWSTDGQLTIVQEQPLPMTILAIMPRARVNEG